MFTSLPVGELRRLGRGCPSHRGEVLRAVRSGGGEGAERTLRDLAFLVSAVGHHEQLLLSYNISLDRRASQKAAVQRTARRVGLEVPDS